MPLPADNRVLKLLRLCGVPDPERLSMEEALAARRAVLADPANQERWNKYVYLTGDVDSASSALAPFDEHALAAVAVPAGWDANRGEREYRERTAARILETQAVYDTPPPAIAFASRVFVFTGRFRFGPRRACRQAVLARGGLIPEIDMVTHRVDYLVVGTKGSDLWKHREYGAKIETAVVERSIHGKPAIVAEEHWRAALAGGVVPAQP